MGYRSEVVAVVATRTKEDLQGIITALPEGTWELIKTSADFSNDGTRVSWHVYSIKWYTERTLGFREEGFDYVNAVEDFIRTAERLNDDYDTDEPNGIASTGALVRVGDDSNDTDNWSWTGFADGLPYAGDLAYISTTIVTDDAIG